MMERIMNSSMAICKLIPQLISGCVTGKRELKTKSWTMPKNIVSIEERNNTEIIFFIIY
jgi:hypothetical protein